MAVSKKFNKIISNYLKIKDVGSGGMGEVFEAIPLDDPSQKVAIKLIRQTGHISHDLLHRFQKEATLMSQLYHPNIITFREFGQIDASEGHESGFESGYFIVMDLAKGKNLKELLNSNGNKGMDLQFFFQLGQQVASALDYTHGKDIIHRDIKPQNIVIEFVGDDGKTISAKVLDFGVAKLGEASNFTGLEKKGFDDFAGTPLYLAPELTKLLEAEVDHRVDLYSLGCVLYEVLTGRTPFIGKSREELKRKHAIEKPASLQKIRPDIPNFVCDLVHKLLAKNPRDRYQSAFSLFSDLKRGEQLVKSLKTGQGLDEASNLLPKLALNDRFKAVAATLPLVGREFEFSKLTSFYNAVASESARGRISVISGSSGVGKSRLIQEIRSYFIERKVRFISGSFTKHESLIPFNALASAFDEYLIKISRSQPLEAQKMQAKFKSTLGTHAYKVAEVIPGLRPYLDGIPKPDIDDNFMDYTSFVKAFTDFTRCLMSSDQPVVFLFDNLHHADEKSLHLMDQFFTYNNSQRIYLIVSYQDGAFFRNEKFNDFLEKISRLRRRFQKFVLEPLDFESVYGLISNMLHIDAAKIPPDLVDYFYKETKGNPVHLVEKMRDLVLHGEIRQNPDSGIWEYNIQEIKAVDRPLQNIDLAMSKFGNFDANERALLEIAAVSGVNFQFELVSMDASITGKNILSMLRKFQLEGLIERYQEDGDLNFLGASYRFTHRSMRESIYDGIEKKLRRSYHLQIADRVNVLSNEFTTQVIFTMVHHLNNAVIGDTAAPTDLLLKCLQFNLKAAGMAGKQGAFPSSIKYYKNSLNIIENYLWNQISVAEKASVYEKLVDVQLKQGDFKESLENLKRILEIVADSKFDQFPRGIYLNVMTLYASIHLREGKISYSFEIAKEAISVVTKNNVAYGFMTKMKFYVFAFLDILGVQTGWFQTKIFDLMKSIKNSQSTSGSALRFYLIAYQSARHINKQLAYMIHQLGYEYALKNQVSPAESFEFFTQRIEVLSSFNFFTVSRRLYRFADKVANKFGFRQVAKTTASKLLYYSQRIGKQEKILDAFQNRDVFKYFAVPHDSLINAEMRGASAFFYLKKGEGQRVSFDVFSALSLVSTRSFISPYLIMIIIYVKLIKGESNTLVVNAQNYLQKRKHRNARQSDPFIYLIHTVVSLINGKFEQSHECYKKAYRLLVDHKSNYMYLPHQLEFASLCLITIPPFFEYSTGRSLFRKGEFAHLTHKLSQLLGTRFASSVLGVSMMNGISQGLQRKWKGVKKLQNIFSISAIKGFELEKMLSSYYAGYILQSQFGKSKGRKELMSALTASRKSRFIGFTRVVENRLEKAGFEYPKRHNRGGLTKVNSRFTNFPTTLAYDYLTKITPHLGHKHINHLLADSLKLFKSHYGGGNIHFLLLSEVGKIGRVIYSHAGAVHDEKMLEFIQPYFDIQMTLFLPCVEMNWHKRQTSTVLKPSFDEEELTQLMNIGIIDEKTEIGYGDEKTVVMPDSGKTQVGNMTQPEFERELVTQAKPLTGGITMCCLVPVVNNGNIIGMVFAEDIGELYQVNSMESRKEIDLFGLQLGFVVAHNHFYTKQVPYSPEKKDIERYISGIYQLEPCEWLNVWQYGRLRKDRESSWYLGINLDSETYLLVYTQLIGDENVRSPISHMIWHHLISFRSQARKMAKNNIVSLNLIYRDLAHILQSVKSTYLLEEISVSISRIQRADKLVESGHFGASRPLVLGGENKVRPENEAILRYQRGGALYYWEVNSSLSDYMPLIMTRNVAQLEKAFSTDDILQVSDLYKYEVPLNASNSDLHEALERVVGIDLVPRYYVGIVLKRSIEEWQNNTEDFDHVG